MDRHPVTRHWFGALESGQWQRYAFTGPGQAGKSLLGFVIPTLHTMFEVGETVFVGIPDMKLAAEKWKVDFLPTIQSSFPNMIPTTSGKGSRGGEIKDSIAFTNGSRLKFMSAGQGDAGLAGPTTRNLVMTEVDKYDTAGEASREADPIRQMEARTNAFRDFGRRIIMECTVSVPHGRIWETITHGTDSRIYHPCPHCGTWATWGRENLIGWEEAKDEFEARDGARWSCAVCGELFGEQERRSMLPVSVLAHRGQELTEGGEVVGPLPRTETFGLRWSAFDNPFISTGRLGQDEWNGSKAMNHDSAERALRQFVWAIPYEPPDIDLTQLEPDAIATRQHATKKAEVPPNCIGVVVGIDTGKRRLHWSAHADLMDGSDVVIDYGLQNTKFETLGITQALIVALQELKAYFDVGWRDEGGIIHHPSVVFIDSGYSEHQAAVYAFCRAVGLGTYYPVKGAGEGVYGGSSRYSPPRQATDVVRYVGRGMHSSWQEAHQVHLIHLDADAWKAEFHSRLKLDANESGAIRLYTVADVAEHADWCNHVTAERQIDVWEAGRRAAIKWEQIRRDNHWLDAGYYGTAAGQFYRDLWTIQQQQKTKQPKAPPPQRSGGGWLPTR